VNSSNDNTSKLQQEQRILQQIRAEMDRPLPNIGMLEILNREYQSLHFGFNPTSQGPTPPSDDIPRADDSLWGRLANNG
jgi:hypothetical protein